MFTLFLSNFYPSHKNFVCKELIVDDCGQISGQKENILMIFELINENNHITNKELSSRVEIAVSAVIRHLSILVENGYIIR